MLKRLLLCLMPFTLTACSHTPVTEYADQEPKLDLFDYFAGNTQAWGQFQNRRGELIRRFTVDITGTVSQTENGLPKLTLDERFIYDDGERQTRIWTIVETAPNQFRGQAGDVVGFARGESAGPALNWQYTLDLPYQDSTIHVQFDDWMYLHDDQTMINRAEVTKWGFKVGEVTLFFRKGGDA